MPDKARSILAPDLIAALSKLDPKTEIKMINWSGRSMFDETGGEIGKIIVVDGVAWLDDTVPIHKALVDSMGLEVIVLNKDPNAISTRFAAKTDQKKKGNSSVD